ncbi:MAG: ribosome maturation factor RimM [Bacteroidales bacterium]|jgi:16S rRNA processing protein RimM|nr:ribosome maturation factor RimM [Bacteroidales bacterium]
MNNQDFFYLGIITKPFGLKGQLFIYLDTDEPEKYCKLKSLFIDIDGDKIPYMIEEIFYKGSNVAVVKFSDLSPEEAKSLIKSELYLPTSILPPLTGNKFYFHEVVGFRVIDAVKGNIGVCSGFLDFSLQPIMQIDFNGKEILIPAVDEFIKGVDRENKRIDMDAPTDLIDIYL